ncbi:amidase [Microcella alkaliphila]|uniref:Amidase n=1 Tax=Microcella alkaliphila TaxID=279828 RepID=A0A4Q7TFK0_9MICO|nr:amidase [Microcella alkaliphila]RZT59261.1 amidase [Microcella alkaliphila]
MTALHELTALEQWSLIRSGEVTPGDLVEHYLARIERLNPEVGALTVVAGGRARDAAARLTETVSTAAPLFGLPLVDKELTARAGQRTTYGSRLFADNVPEASDELARHLDEAGAISLGASAAPEFGLPSYTESRVAPPARTPHALDRGAGGSSGGAAAAVAAGLVPFAPGSDGGGSIRIPAAACGIVGLKPSRGRVPAGSGLASLAGLVVAGPLARTVADAALLLDALVSASPWPFATRAAGPAAEGPFLAHAVRGEGRVQVGVLTESPWQLDYELTIAPEARHALDRAIRHLDDMGHGVDDIDLGPSDDWAGYPDAFRIVWMAAAAGIPAESDAELALLEPLTAWLVARGRELPVARLTAALSWLSGFERRLIARFSSVDVVMTPALALTPRPLGWYDAGDAERNFAQQVQYTPWTSMINVAGLPAITIPMGLSRESDGELSDRPGMPMGVQLIGRPGGEATLLAVAAQLERRLRLPSTPVLD